MIHHLGQDIAPPAPRSSMPNLWPARCPAPQRVGLFLFVRPCVSACFGVARRLLAARGRIHRQHHGMSQRRFRDLHVVPALPQPWWDRHCRESCRSCAARSTPRWPAGEPCPGRRQLPQQPAWRYRRRSALHHRNARRRRKLGAVIVAGRFSTDTNGRISTRWLQKASGGRQARGSSGQPAFSRVILKLIRGELVLPRRIRLLSPDHSRL